MPPGLDGAGVSCGNSGDAFRRAVTGRLTGSLLHHKADPLAFLPAISEKASRVFDPKLTAASNTLL